MGVFLPISMIDFLIIKMTFRFKEIITYYSIKYSMETNKNLAGLSH